VIYLHFFSTAAAYEMMMFVSSDLVCKMPAAFIGRASQVVFGEELQCAIDSGFSKPGQFIYRLLIYFCRR
jgi:hypothetical protein